MLGSATVKAALEDPDSAPIEQKLKATLRFLEKLTLKPQEVEPGDVKILLELGVTATGIKDAIRICALFNLIDRVADALGFEIPSERGLARSAKLLLWRGYS